jgi:hypothetical protein
MSRNIPRVQRWRVTVFWNKPQGTTIADSHYVNAPNKRFAWWNARDEILADIGAARFIARDRVTVELTHK